MMNIESVELSIEMAPIMVVSGEHFNRFYSQKFWRGHRFQYIGVTIDVLAPTVSRLEQGSAKQSLRGSGRNTLPSFCLLPTPFSAFLLKPPPSRVIPTADVLYGALKVNKSLLQFMAREIANFSSLTGISFSFSSLAQIFQQHSNHLCLINQSDQFVRFIFIVPFNYYFIYFMLCYFLI